MAHRLPAQPAPRVIHYIDPTMPATGMTVLTERELLARRERDRVLYARWVQRRAQLAERDRKVRRFWLGFGAVVGVAGLALVGWLVWFVFHAAASLRLFAIPLALLALSGLVAGGHRCVTIVQHMH